MTAYTITISSLLVTMGLHPEISSASISPGHWEMAWSWETGIVLPLIAMAVLYAVGTWRIRKRNQKRTVINGWQLTSFWSGWLTLVLALDSPLHKLGEVLFSAHMTQHELLMVVAAPLIAFSKPLIAGLFALPELWRVRIGALTKTSWFSAGWSRLSAPLTVWCLHGSTIWAWHIPFLYQATLDNEAVHALQHICFLGTALLFWWTLVHGRYGRLGYGVAFVYVFTTALHTSVLGALMTFTRQVWYPLYDGRTAAWHLSPLEDQQLGGLIMWIPSGVVFLVVGLAMLAAWIGESERRQKLSHLAELEEQHGD